MEYYISLGCKASVSLSNVVFSMYFKAHGKQKNGGGVLAACCHKCPVVRNIGQKSSLYEGVLNTKKILSSISDTGYCL